MWLKRFITWFFSGTDEQRQARALKVEKRHAARLYTKRKREKHAIEILQKARAATSELFVIADLETTGLSSDAQILEFAAILADVSGRIHAELSLLVHVRGRIPSKITELTGITHAMINQEGLVLEQAMPRFLTFCANHPVFFHNAPFDTRFIRLAALKLGLKFPNPVYCSLKIARAAWPELSSHKLEALARHIGKEPPTHRALDDVKVTLSVLLAVRSVALMPSVV